MSKYHNIINGNVIWLTPEEEVALEAQWAAEQEARKPTFEQLRQNKLVELANKRWEKETGGTTFNGMPLATDTVSQTKYVGAVVAAQISPLMTLKWKLSDGSFIDLDATTITQVAMAVRSHIQACFDKEAEYIELIKLAANQEDLDAIDINIGWP